MLCSKYHYISRTTVRGVKLTVWQDMIDLAERESD